MQQQSHCSPRHALCLLFTALVPTVAYAQDDDNIYCLQYDRNAGVDDVYYSGVFAGDYGSTLGYENDFYDYLESRGFEPDITESYCFFHPTLPAAERDMLSKIEEDRRYGYTAVRTEWRPEGSAAFADVPISPQPLRDFRISVPVSPYGVGVCVRDHECEDGDRVRVSVNGIELMSEEIVKRLDVPDIDLAGGASQYRALRHQRHGLQGRGLFPCRRKHGRDSGHGRGLADAVVAPPGRGRVEREH